MSELLLAKGFAKKKAGRGEENRMANFRKYHNISMYYVPAPQRTTKPARKMKPYPMGMSAAGSKLNELKRFNYTHYSCSASNTRGESITIIHKYV